MIIDPPKQQETETALHVSRSPNDSPSTENVPVYTPTTHHLHLDPGPRQRLPRKITPQGVCFGISFLLMFFLGMSILSFIQSNIQRFGEPHYDIGVYQDPKLGVIGGPGVVKPLIGKKGELGSRFDIVATVWVREGLYVSQRDNVKLGDSGRETVERVLFSKTVFANVSLQDTRVKTAVNLEIPTDIFKNKVLHDTDLRASFVIIPHSPSFLDKAVNYSTANGKALHLPPVRPYSDGSTASLADEIIDSYGISTRLLEFHPTSSRCRQQAIKQEDYPMDDDDDDDDEDDNESGWTDSFQLRDAKSREPLQNLNPQSTVDLPVLAFHPYIITRTYLRVVDITLLYNRKAFDKQHKMLKRRKMACTRNTIKNELSCTRNFVTYGNFETKIRVQYPNKKPDHEWAYAPYMDTAESSWGPKDLIPIPVNREECAPSSDGGSSLLAPDEGRVNVTWHLTYSGQEWGKLFYGDTYSQFKSRLNMSASEGEKIRAQWEYASSQGLIGHPFHDDFHPRRQFILRWLSKTLVAVNLVMVAYYFHTIDSTVGISVVATKLYAAGWILDYTLLAIVNSIADKKNLFEFVFHLCWTSIPQVAAFLMLKAAWRVEFEWSSKGVGVWGFLPSAKFVPPTHRERMSVRREERISGGTKIVLFCCLGIAVHSFRMQDYHITNPRNPTLPSHKTQVEEYINVVQEIVVIPSFVLGKTLQLLHNQWSRTFAGTTKISALIALIAMSTQVASESESVVGYMDVHNGLRLGTACVLVALLVEVGQSWIFESVSSIDDDVDSQ